MITAHQDLDIGHEIEPVTYEITQEKINIYSRYVFNGRDTKNIHTDDEVARKAGLPQALAQGRYPIGYISERMVDFFGQGWLQGGRIEVSLVKGIFPGDTITVKGVITEKTPEGDKIRLVLDVWLENQHGEPATAGVASGLVEA
ncbi:MAG: MaoC family dehydratase [bacterium]|nr:MaoC family dehydratase [bacterium]